ncbi:cellulase family glycosylhydrolase [uncultured Duncaniella sp.]|uniref:cellulase family glycosylhydrolase n=3 Tax=uncultured Duncaniella sp. TaxID=2768039 RepID=UPI0025D88DA1|nr:cellulase family glycosylhydrolase [uncultured Duncaniella sp.]
MKTLRLFLSAVLATVAMSAWAWPGMDMPVLHVDGRYLKDTDGNIVNLHGFAQTYSPWFNEQGTKWSNYDVDACLKYNKQKIDEILVAGWKMSFLRLHADPYWSNTPGVATTGENDISAFDFNRFTTYLHKVFIPMAEYAVSKGLYVVMRPPGVCPENIEIGDAYHRYLKKVWGYVSTQAKLKNNPHIMFELANEPIHIKGSDGQFGANTDGCFKNLTIYFQEIVDLMRSNGCENILWIPGTGYQSQYAGFAKYPVKGENIGYAVHVYPGWYGSDAIEPSHELGGSYGGGFSSFSAGWDAQIKPVADFAPVMVTEMDWAPSKYEASWGKSITGTMLGEGFGANFKLLADNSGNVSWLLFTGCEYLAQFKDTPATTGNYTFLNDPQACPWSIYHWFKEYAGDPLPEPESVGLSFSSNQDGDECVIMTGSSLGAAVIANYKEDYQSNVSSGLEISIDNPQIVDWSDGKFNARSIGTTTASVSYSVNGTRHDVDVKFESTPFPLINGYFNPSIWETGSFNQSTHEITTGKYGFAGWKYPSGLDLSAYRYLIAEMDGPNNSAVSFRIFDTDNYWSDPGALDFGNGQKVVFDLSDVVSGNGRKMDMSHVFILGFWSWGNAPFRIKSVYVSDNPDGESGLDLVVSPDKEDRVDVYNLQGVKVRSDVPAAEACIGLQPGIYVAGGRKLVVK